MHIIFGTLSFMVVNGKSSDSSLEIIKVQCLKLQMLNSFGVVSKQITQFIFFIEKYMSCNFQLFQQISITRSFIYANLKIHHDLSVVLDLWPPTN